MKYWERIGLVKMEEIIKSKNLIDFYNNLTIRIVG
jgi:hypothetical protein